MKERKRRKLIEDAIRQLLLLYNGFYVNLEGKSKPEPPLEALVKMLRAVFSVVEIKTGKELREDIVLSDLSRFKPPTEKEWGKISDIVMKRGIDLEQAHLAFRREEEFQEAEISYLVVGPDLAEGLGETVVGGKHPFRLRMNKSEMNSIEGMLAGLVRDLKEDVVPELRVLGTLTEDIWMEDDTRWDSLPGPRFFRSIHYKVATQPGESAFAGALTYLDGPPMAVASLFSGNWVALSSFVRSLFVSYYIEVGDFKRLRLCENCGGLYLTGRLTPDGRFCSDKCRKYDFSCKPLEKCYRRQMSWIRYRFDKLNDLRGRHDKEQKALAGDYIEPNYPKRVDVCQSCLHITKPLGGKCRHFYVANEDLIKRYDYCKERDAWKSVD